MAVWNRLGRRLCLARSVSVSDSRSLSLTTSLGPVSYEEEDTCHMRRRIHVWPQTLGLCRRLPLARPPPVLTSLVCGPCMCAQVSSGAYDMYPPPHMTCILLLICVHRYPAERISILSTYNGQVAPATHRLEVAYFKTLEP